MKPSNALFACAKCGAQSSKWAGRCPECQAWGTLAEETPTAAPAARSVATVAAGAVRHFSELQTQTQTDRLKTELSYLDRLLGGGLVSGSVTLLGGEPGIGKSTLLSQMSLILAIGKRQVLYVTGEESPTQVNLRLRRLSPVLPESINFLDDTRAEVVAATILENKPAFVIVDSIQSMTIETAAGEAGSPSQVRAAGAVLCAAAKSSGVPVILVGQVTKEGELAGPRLLEHIVDTVVMMEGDRSHQFRVLRALKNRFGPTDEAAILEMTERGLEEVADPSAALLAHRPTQVSGSLITCLLQGVRPIMLEIQALVTPAGYGTPTRRVSGVDTNRLSLLLAVLGRRVGINLFDQDVFVNAVGGLDAKDPSLDLALALALASAAREKPIPPNVAAWGEVGLAGEIRPVAQSGLRIKEAMRLGFTKLIVPSGQSTSVAGVTLIPCQTVREALEKLSV